jgi:hydrogenase-4 component F
MIDNILFIFCLPTLISLGIILWMSTCYKKADSHHYSTLAIFHATLYMGLSIWLCIFDQLIELSGNGYFYLDALALFEILILAALFLLAAIYSRGYIKSLLDKNEIDPNLLPVFYGTSFLLQLVLIMGFLSDNLALLWIFVELSTVFSAVLIITLKAKENITVALKYIFIASTSMLFSFMGIIILFSLSQEATVGGTLSWTGLMANAATFNQTAFNVAFVLSLIGFGAKAGMVPFHTWMPHAYTKAPSVVSVMYGPVLNLGLFAVIRLYAIGNQVGNTWLMNTTLLSIGILTIFVAAFSMLARHNTKKIVAFSAIEQTGLAMVGMSLANPLAFFWVIFNQLAQPFVKALLFFSAGIWHRQYSSNKLAAIQNPIRYQPLASTGIIIGAAAIVGAPLLPVFLVKFNILSVLAAKPLLLLLVLLLFLVAASGIGYYFIRAFTQSGESEIEIFSTPFSMNFPIIICILIIFLIGTYIPAPLSELINTILIELGIGI